MAFGADNVEPAERSDEFPFRLHVFALLDLFDALLPFVLRNVETRRVFRLEDRPRERLGIAPEDNVGTAARHVRGDRYGVEPTGLRDDFRFASDVFGLRVEDLMLNSALRQLGGDQFALLNRNGADEDRTAFSAHALNSRARHAFGVAIALLLEFDLVVRFLLNEPVERVALVVDELVPLVNAFNFVDDRVVLSASVL